MTVSPELDARFRDAAAAEGLLDVAYDLVDTPVGPLLVAVTDRGLCEISFDPEPDREAEALARAFGARVLRSPRPTDEARRQLIGVRTGPVVEAPMKRSVRAVGRITYDDLTNTVFVQAAPADWAEIEDLIRMIDEGDSATVSGSSIWRPRSKASSR